MTLPTRSATIGLVVLVMLGAAGLLGAGNAAAQLDEPPDPAILWSADHETGDLQQWTRDQGWRWWDDDLDAVVDYDTGSDRNHGEAVFNSRTAPGNCVTSVTDEVAHSGRYAMKLALTGASDAKQGCRTFRRYLSIDGPDGVPMPDDAYYSAWYFLPHDVTTDVWWNIFQFKSSGSDPCNDPARNEQSSHAMFSVDMVSENDERYVTVYHKKPCAPYCADDCVWESYGPTTDVTIPIGEWFHLEARLQQGSVFDGQIMGDGALTIWVDGVEVIHRGDIPTLVKPGDRLQWSVNSYTNNITPADVDLYVDDAAISTRRLGGEAVVDPPEEPDEVQVSISCLASNGRVDVNVVNQSATPGEFIVEYADLTPRAITVAPADWGRISITGRPDGGVPLTVRRGDEVLVDTIVSVSCDGPSAGATGAEVRALSACRNGLGFVLFQFVNDNDEARPYVIEFDGVPNRSTSAAPFGAAVRGVSGRPDGVYAVVVRSQGTVIHTSDVEVTCGA